MLPVLVASAAWAAALLGLGRLAARHLAPDADPGTTGLLGLLVLAVAGTAVHLVAQVGPWVAGAALLAGLAAFAWRAREILRGTSRPAAAALLALLAALSALAGVPERHYDMGLYWLQAVKWTTEAAQAPGLATLHARLGFNSAWFTVAAMLEHPLAVGRSAFLATTTLLFFAGWQALGGAREVAAGRRGLGPLLAAGGLLVVAACAGQVGGHSPDAAGAVLGYASLVAWARALEGEERPGGHAAAATLLALFAFTVKLSYALLPAASLLLLAARHPRLARRDLLALAAAAAALLVPWVAAGYLASGCPLFPSQVACLPLPWATPPTIGAEVGAWIRSWARAPGLHPSQVLGGWGWLPGWLDLTLPSALVRLVLAALVASAAALGGLAAAGAGRPGRPAWTLLAIAAAGTALWFSLAPTPRFGWAYLLGLALVPAAEAGRLALRRWSGRGAAVALALLLAGGAGWLLSESLAWLGRVPLEAHPVRAWPAMPAARTREAFTLPGDRVLLPARGDQCWDAPRPCTPYFDPGLSLGPTIRTATPAPVHP